MKTLLIVYHTMTGGTGQMARAAADAASQHAGVTVVLRRATDAGPDDVLAADGYLFATPENLAATIYEALGVPRTAQWYDQLERPHHVYNADPIPGLR